MLSFLWEILIFQKFGGGQYWLVGEGELPLCPYGKYGLHWHTMSFDNWAHSSLNYDLSLFLGCPFLYYFYLLVSLLLNQLTFAIFIL